jgi:hypothetical protein
MDLRRIRRFQIAGISLITVAIIAPAAQTLPLWPRMTEQDQQLELAVREAVKESTIAKEAETVTDPVQAEPAAPVVAQEPQKKTAKRPRRVIAAAPVEEEEIEEPEIVDVPNARFKDRALLRVLAKMERRENDCEDGEECEE